MNSVTDSRVGTAVSEPKARCRGKGIEEVQHYVMDDEEAAALLMCWTVDRGTLGPLLAEAGKVIQELATHRRLNDADGFRNLTRAYVALDAMCDALVALHDSLLDTED